MRVSDGGARPPGRRPGPEARAFGGAMRRARDQDSLEARGPGGRAGASPRARADRPDRVAGGRPAPDAAERGDAAATLAPAAGHGAASGSAPEVSGAAQLRAALRALPLAIGPATVRDGAPLSLSLGRALDVDLRAGPAGVEVVLRPELRLARAAEAELPALVASMRSRGIAVARAEVRARGGRGGGAR